jgi:hypothetical protein
VGCDTFVSVACIFSTTARIALLYSLSPLGQVPASLNRFGTNQTLPLYAHETFNLGVPPATRTRLHLCPPRGTERSVQFPEAIRSRADARAGLAALSDERLAEDDSSSAATHIRRLIRDLLSADAGCSSHHPRRPSRHDLSVFPGLYGLHQQHRAHSSFSDQPGCR